MTKRTRLKASKSGHYSSDVMMPGSNLATQKKKRQNKDFACKEQSAILHKLPDGTALKEPIIMRVAFMNSQKMCCVAYVELQVQCSENKQLLARYAQPRERAQLVQ